MGPVVTIAVSSRLRTPPGTAPRPGVWLLEMGWPRLRVVPLKLGASKIIVMIDGMIGEMTVEAEGKMIAAVIATATTIAETTEEMIGVNPMKIAEMPLRVSRLLIDSCDLNGGDRHGIRLRVLALRCGSPPGGGRDSFPSLLQLLTAKDAAFII